MRKIQKRSQCGKCGALEGQYHMWFCDVERCPFCGRQLISCDCCYEKLGLIDKKLYPFTEGLHPDIYENGLTDEQHAEWCRILEERGRVPFVYKDFTQVCRRCRKKGKLTLLDPEYIPKHEQEWFCASCASQIKEWIDLEDTRMEATEKEIEVDQLQEKLWRKMSRSCPHCKHYYLRGDSELYTCSAFPDGIPEEILYQEFNHEFPYPNFKNPEDNGIRFEQVQPKKAREQRPEVHTFDSIEDAFTFLARAVSEEKVFVASYPDSKHLAAFRYLCEHTGENKDIDQSFEVFTRNHYGWRKVS